MLNAISNPTIRCPIFTSLVNENLLLFFHGTFHEDGMKDLKELN